jgi:hypothetical protein
LFDAVAFQKPLCLSFGAATELEPPPRSQGVGHINVHNYYGLRAQAQLTLTFKQCSMTNSNGSDEKLT